MAAVLMQEVAIDGYGNHFDLFAEEIATDVVNNTSTIKCWLDLYVVGSVASANVRVNVSSGQESNLGYQSWGPGGYRLKEATFTAWHNPDGSGSMRIEGYFTGAIGTWNLSGTLPLTTLPRQSTINSFTGTDITKAFKATYTAKSAAYTNKLRISIPGVKALEVYNNYVSGSNVYLSKASVDYIKNYTRNKTIQLGGVIETWYGGSKIGESSEIKVTCNIRRDMYIKVNGTYKRAIAYVRSGGTWKEARPYLRNNNQWKEGI